MIKSTVLTLAVGVALSGTALAAGMMTDTEKATMQQCQGMSESATKADKNCTALMKKYPDGMKGNSMDNDTMNNKSMSK